MKDMRDFINAILKGMDEKRYLPKQDNHGFSYVIVDVDVEDWINDAVFPKCKVQNKDRAERQSKKAHLNGVGGMNLESVACAIRTKHTEDGEEHELLCKIDGHSRALAWKEGKLKKPGSTLDCKVYFLGVDDDDVKLTKLFRAYDSKDSVENSADIVFGTMNMMDFEGKSELCKNTFWASAWKGLLRVEGVRAKDIKNELLYKMLQDHGYDNVMKIIDSLGCKLSKKVDYPVGLRMAMMYSIKHDTSKDLKSSLAVWGAYRDAVEGKIAERGIIKRIHCAVLRVGYGSQAQKELFFEIVKIIKC